ncbi:phosphoenolpyruvate carboxykinase (ATP) [Vampirovibrio chlorellavorus]|uniref:phosphoenolpyruvate carboxykinase (ATP) n=1 Tax=Vampirovibrio chlorellavorus TaxID=758823 RepID=UPI0026EFB178|nr:phosphoenolpyruvate carboxykinase (ATP) [Vampirovibrio chlorellavorus]
MTDYIGYTGIQTTGCQAYQLPVSKLVELALANGEGLLSETGALSVNTGKFTGRAPNDRFIVDTPDIHNEIDWGKVNVSTSPQVFDNVLKKMQAYFSDKNVFIFDGLAGADPHYALKVRFINELASHNLFVHQMFVRPEPSQLEGFAPEFTVICAPLLELDPATEGTHSEAVILVNFEKKMVLIAGTRYAGEMKKSIFSVMNYLMPERQVFPMHCSVNVGNDGKSAIFFGLSGTGKTTLSADPERTLIGDDEHGWSDKGLFNFEGGCYAKTIRLSRENEPEIWDAIRFGAITENIVLDANTRQFEYDDARYTENSRVAYPIDFIHNADPKGVAGHPSAIIFLTADAFGVLPAVSKLTEEQAQYHFISGYTSKVAGTEQGITEPVAAFSTCFGAPFMPRPAAVYAQMLTERIRQHQVSVYLINTGWQGGPYGLGKRVSIPHTRAMVTAALNGSLDQQTFEIHPVFNVLVPKACPGVPAEVLDARGQWADKTAYDQTAAKLAHMFVENFKKFHGVEHLVSAGPRVPATIQ